MKTKEKSKMEIGGCFRNVENLIVLLSLASVGLSAVGYAIIGNFF